MTQSVLAKKAGITQGSLAHFEANKSSPSLETLYSLGSALGISPALFFANDDIVVFDVNELRKYKWESELPDRLFRELNTVVMIGLQLGIAWDGQ